MSELLKRVMDYLAGGGLFNPELANHDAVRDLVIDLRTELDRLRAENERLHERLEDNHVFDSAGKRIEVTPGTIPDGIACRDETIRLQDNDNEWLRRALERSQGAEADVANLLLRAERAEAALATARRDALEEAAAVADKADDLTGGVYGGPSSCIHGCGEVIAEAIRARMAGK